MEKKEFIQREEKGRYFIQRKESGRENNAVIVADKEGKINRGSRIYPEINSNKFNETENWGPYETYYEAVRGMKKLVEKGPTRWQSVNLKTKKWAEREYKRIENEEILKENASPLHTVLTVGSDKYYKNLNDVKNSLNVKEFPERTDYLWFGNALITAGKRNMVNITEDKLNEIVKPHNLYKVTEKFDGVENKITGVNEIDLEYCRKALLYYCGLDKKDDEAKKLEWKDTEEGKRERRLVKNAVLDGGKLSEIEAEKLLNDIDHNLIRENHFGKWWGVLDFKKGTLDVVLKYGIESDVLQEIYGEGLDCFKGKDTKQEIYDTAKRNIKTVEVYVGKEKADEILKKVENEEGARSLSCIFNLKSQKRNFQNFQWNFIRKGTKQFCDNIFIEENKKNEIVRKWKIQDMNFTNHWVLERDRKDGQKGIQVFVFDDNFNEKSAKVFLNQYDRKTGRDKTAVIAGKNEKKRKAGVRV